MAKKIDRRSFLKKSAVVSAAAIGGLTLEEKILLAGRNKNDQFKKDKAKPDSKSMPTGRIGNVSWTNYDKYNQKSIYKKCGCLVGGFWEFDRSQWKTDN